MPRAHVVGISSKRYVLHAGGQKKKEGRRETGEEEE